MYFRKALWFPCVYPRKPWGRLKTKWRTDERREVVLAERTVFLASVCILKTTIMVPELGITTSNVISSGTRLEGATAYFIGQFDGRIVDLPISSPAPVMRRTVLPFKRLLLCPISMKLQRMYGGLYALKRTKVQCPRNNYRAFSGIV